MAYCTRVLTVTLIVFVLIQIPCSQAEQPHIIFIVADDLGKLFSFVYIIYFKPTCVDVFFSNLSFIHKEERRESINFT